MFLILRQPGALKTLGLALCSALVLIAAGAFADESESEPATGQDFRQYRILLERNIFDATRDRPRPQVERVREPRPTPPPNPDHLDVTGAFMQGDQAIVFFEGSKSDFNQAIGAGAFIAGAQLAEVSTEQVVLDFGEGERVVVPVGGRLMIQPDGTTSVVEMQRTDRRAPRTTAAARRDAEDLRNVVQQAGGRGGGDLRGMIQGFVAGGGLEQMGFPGGMMGAFGGGPGGGPGGGGRGGGPQQQLEVQVRAVPERTLSDDEQAAILERLRARREEEMGQ